MTIQNTLFARFFVRAFTGGGIEPQFNPSDYTQNLHASNDVQERELIINLTDKRIWYCASPTDIIEIGAGGGGASVVVVDNLITASSDNALSAGMGKALKDLLDLLKTEVDTAEADLAQVKIDLNAITTLTQQINTLLANKLSIDGTNTPTANIDWNHKDIMNVGKGDFDKIILHDAILGDLEWLNFQEFVTEFSQPHCGWVNRVSNVGLVFDGVSWSVMNLTTNTASTIDPNFIASLSGQFVNNIKIGNTQINNADTGNYSLKLPEELPQGFDSGALVVDRATGNLRFVDIAPFYILPLDNTFTGQNTFEQVLKLKTLVGGGNVVADINGNLRLDTTPPQKEGINIDGTNSPTASINWNTKDLLNVNKGAFKSIEVGKATIQEPTGTAPAYSLRLPGTQNPNAASMLMATNTGQMYWAKANEGGSLTESSWDIVGAPAGIPTDAKVFYTLNKNSGIITINGSCDFVSTDIIVRSRKDLVFQITQPELLNIDYPPSGKYKGIFSGSSGDPDYIAIHGGVEIYNEGGINKMMLTIRHHEQIKKAVPVLITFSITVGTQI